MKKDSGVKTWLYPMLAMTTALALCGCKSSFLAPRTGEYFQTTRMGPGNSVCAYGLPLIAGAGCLMSGGPAVVLGIPLVAVGIPVAGVGFEKNIESVVHGTDEPESWTWRVRINCAEDGKCPAESDYFIGEDESGVYLSPGPFKSPKEDYGGKAVLKFRKAKE